MFTAKRLCALLWLAVVMSAHAAPVPKSFFVRTDVRPAAAVYDARHGVVYVSAPELNQVHVFDATGMIVKSIPVQSPSGIDITVAGDKLIVGATSGWIGLDFLTIIDTNRQEVIERVQLPLTIARADGVGSPSDSTLPFQVLALANGQVLIISRTQGSTANALLEWDPATGLFRELVLPGAAIQPCVMSRSADHKRVVLVDACSSSGEIAMFDSDADDFTAFTDRYFGNYAGLPAINPDGSQLAVTIEQHTLVILDSSLQEIHRLNDRFQGTPIYSPDGSVLYVTQGMGMASEFHAYAVAGFAYLGGQDAPAMDHSSPGTPLGWDARGFMIVQYEHGIVLLDVSSPRPIPADSPSVNLPYAATPHSGSLDIPGNTVLGVFNDYSAPIVWFSDQQASSAVVGTNGISVSVPSGSRPGPVDVVVNFADGRTAFIPEGFSYGPKIHYLDRDGGSTAGGDQVEMLAWGVEAGSQVQVTIGGRPATVTAVTGIGISPFSSPEMRIEFTTPPGPPGSADVMLQTAAGNWVLPDGFTYHRMSNVGGSPVVAQMVFDRFRRRIYRARYGDNLVEVFHVDSQTWQSPYQTGVNPVALALSPDGQTLYTANASGSVSIIDLNTGTSRNITAVPSNNWVPWVVAATSTGKLFLGAYATDLYDYGALFQIDPGTGAITRRLESAYLRAGVELGASQDGSRIFVGQALTGASSGMDLYIWDAFTDSFRSRFLEIGWQDYAVDDTGSRFAGNWTIYNDGLAAEEQLRYFTYNSYTFSDPEPLEYGEKLHGSGALLYAPAKQSLFLFDVGTGSLLQRIALSDTVNTVPDAMVLDRTGGNVYLSTPHGLLAVELSRVPLSVGRVDPNQGFVGGGQAVTIYGTGFQPGAVVAFDAVEVQTTYVDSNTLRVQAPALPDGPVALTVRNPDDHSYKLPAAFTVVDSSPILTATNPGILYNWAWLNFNGQYLSVFGMNFVEGSTGYWNGTPRPTEFVADDQLRVHLTTADVVDVPAPGSGVLTVKNPGGGLSNALTVPIATDAPTLSVPELGFPAQQVGTASTKTGTISNTGKVPVRFNVAVQGDYTQANDCSGGLDPGAACTVSITFAPTAAGNRDGTLWISGDVLRSATLRGAAGVPGAAISANPLALQFDPAYPNSGSERYIYFTNIGLDNLNISSVATDNPEFTIVNYCSPGLPTGARCPVNVRFTASGAGMRSGTLTVTSNAAPLTVPLSGMSLPAGVFSTASVDFQPQLIGSSSAARSATFTNQGSALQVTAISTTDSQFSATHNCPATLAPGNSCIVSVVFKPSTGGSHTASVQLATSAGSYSLRMTGSGTDFSIKPAANAPTSLTINAGETASYDLVLDGSGGYAGTVNLSCSGAPAYATCIVAGVGQVSSTPTALNVKVTTTARSAVQAAATKARPGKLMLFFAAAFPMGLLLLHRSPHVRAKARPMALGVMVLMTMIACGGGGSHQSPPAIGTPNGTYTLTVAASAGGATRSIMLSLTVR